jgi:hypothetical protein
MIAIGQPARLRGAIASEAGGGSGFWGLWVKWKGERSAMAESFFKGVFSMICLTAALS